MLITILPKEIDIEPWKLAHIYNLSIDYYTNTVYGVFEGEDVVLYNFNKCGWLNDNRHNSYSISCGLAGIFIQIKPN